jgi:hypothetical protein
VDRRGRSTWEKIRIGSQRRLRGAVATAELLISGEAPLVVATGTGALTSHVLGVKDQVIILTFVNRVAGMIVTKDLSAVAAESHSTHGSGSQVIN